MCDSNCIEQMYCVGFVLYIKGFIYYLIYTVVTIQSSPYVIHKGK